MKSVVFYTISGIALLYAAGVIGLATYALMPSHKAIRHDIAGISLPLVGGLFALIFIQQMMLWSSR